MPDREPFTYIGDPDWLAPIAAALREVVDPEAALSIVDMGLVLSVVQQPDAVHVRLTMTSAACPVADVLVEEARQALDRVLPPQMQILVELCLDELWTPDRMSDSVRRLMGW